MTEYHRFNSMKILAHADRLRSIALGGMPYPLDWHIYPSNQCNHSCSWCMFKQNGERTTHPSMLSRNHMVRAVVDAQRTGAALIHFSGGGEPLWNENTPVVMEHAQALGLAVALSTNGSRLSASIARNVDYLRISLNAGTEDQHRRTNHTGNGVMDWEKILANISTAVEHKKKDVGLGFVVDHDNYEDIYPFCKLASELGVDFVHIRPAFWYDSAVDLQTRMKMPFALDECDRARQDFGKNLDIFAITEKFNGYWTPRSYDRCRATLTGVCLTATGEFAVCQDRTDLRFGAAYKSDASFEEVWNSEEHRVLVDSLTSPGVMDKCPRCVWNKRNEIIEEVFVKDEMRLEMV